MTTETIRTLILQNFDLGPEWGELPDDLPLIENYVLDSLDLLSLVSLIETKLDVPVRDEDVVLENFGTIARIAAYVDGRRAVS